MSAALAGCHVKHGASRQNPVSPAPSSTTTPTTEPVPTRVAETESEPTSAPVTTAAPSPQVVDSSRPTPPPASDTLKDVLPPKKPFIAAGQWFKSGPDQPTVLLKQFARNDSPVPLSLYDRQPIYAIQDFNLRLTLSASEVRQRLGPPAQLADYDQMWLVYRLSNGRELWLRFTDPEPTRLLYADVVSQAEDGYIRRRIFSYDGTQ
jgi:hypothetical protein